MAEEMKEPQSYGSQSDWTTGRTGEHVNDPASGKPAEHRDFYDSRREKETSAPDQGGQLQPKWTDDVDVLRPAAGLSEKDDPARNVAAEFSGARRDSYFRKRDYE